MQLDDYLMILSKQQTTPKTTSISKSKSKSKSTSKTSPSTSSLSYALRLSFLQPLVVVSLNTVQLSLSMSEITFNLQSSSSSSSLSSSIVTSSNSSLDDMKSKAIIPSTQMLSMATPSATYSTMNKESVWEVCNNDNRSNSA